MITLKTSLLSENLGFNNEDIELKSISSAWNKIREIRDTTPVNEIEGTVLTIEGAEGKMPEKILFKANKKGKVEFKDLSKISTKGE